MPKKKAPAPSDSDLDSQSADHDNTRAPNQTTGNMDSVSENDRLMLEAGKWKRKFEEQEAQIDYYENQLTEGGKEKDAADKKVGELETQLREARLDLERQKREWESTLEEQKQLHGENEDLTASFTSAGAETDALKDERDKLQRLLDNYEKDTAAMRSDAKGLLAMNQSLTEERDEAWKELKSLRQRNHDLEQLNLDVEKEKSISADLVHQIEKARAEMPRFDLDPEAYRTTAKPKEQKGGRPRNLSNEFEFEEKPAGEEVSSSEEELSSSDDEEKVEVDRKPDRPRYVKKIIRVIRKVPGWAPSSRELTFTHLLWVWYDLLVLCSLFIQKAINRDILFRRRHGILPSGSSPPPIGPKSPLRPAPPRNDSGNTIPTGDGKTPASEDNPAEGSGTPPGNEPTRHRSNTVSTMDTVSSTRSDSWASDFQEPPDDAGYIFDPTRTSIHSQMARVVRGRENGEGISPQTDLSPFLDPAPPPTDTREKFLIASQDGATTPTLPILPLPQGVGISSLRILTPEEVEKLYPLREGEEEGIENIEFNDPSTIPVEQNLWEGIKHPDPHNRPDALKTYINILLQLIFFWWCYMLYAMWQERQNWTDANNITQSFFDDLFQNRNHYGRDGIVTSLLGEEWASGFDRLFVSFAKLIGDDMEAYAIPG